MHSAPALLVVSNLRAVEERWAHAGRASIYLKDTATQDDVEMFRSALAKVPGITQVKYISSGQARAEFGAEEVPIHPELAALPVEAFPASIEIEVRPDLPEEDLAAIVAKVRQLPAVDDIETYRAWTDRLASLVRGGVAASLLLAFVVLCAVLAVVGSTIRLALSASGHRGGGSIGSLARATRFVKGPLRHRRERRRGARGSGGTRPSGATICGRSCADGR